MIRETKTLNRSFKRGPLRILFKTLDTGVKIYDDERMTEQDLWSPFASGTVEKPFVVGQLGQSLDGRIALPCGESKYINGEGGLNHLHLLRAHVDAVMVGIGTVLADDPRLDVRRVDGHNPARIVIDPRGKLPLSARLLKNDGVRRMVISHQANPYLPFDIEQLVVQPDKGIIPPKTILQTLGQKGFKRILLEGGARTLSFFLQHHCLDRLHMLIAPVILGAGQTGINYPAPACLAEALRPQSRCVILQGGDVLFDLDLRKNEGEIS
jgi:diaminohydroxyphosphoribosylaminopyrimidine deaminase / 5-amino-6-(5-phosphoribosylamino)uracil reductase